MSSDFTNEPTAQFLWKGRLVRHVEKFRKVSCSFQCSDYGGGWLLGKASYSDRNTSTKLSRQRRMRERSLKSKAHWHHIFDYGARTAEFSQHIDPRMTSDALSVLCSRSSCEPTPKYGLQMTAPFVDHSVFQASCPLGMESLVVY